MTLCQESKRPVTNERDQMTHCEESNDQMTLCQESKSNERKRSDDTCQGQDDQMTTEPEPV